MVISFSSVPCESFSLQSYLAWVVKEGDSLRSADSRSGCPHMTISSSTRCYPLLGRDKILRTLLLRFHSRVSLSEHCRGKACATPVRRCCASANLCDGVGIETR